MEASCISDALLWGAIVALMVVILQLFASIQAVIRAVIEVSDRLDEAEGRPPAPRRAPGSHLKIRS